MISYWVGKAWLKVFGWRLEGELPKSSKFVLIAAPHTSNWDTPFMLATAYCLRADISWLGKHTLFEGAFRGPFFKWLGGIPVDRRSPQSMVNRVVELFGQSDKLILAVAPDGTRGKANWKSGFYHIANGAKVPIAPGFLDYGRKVCGLGPPIMPTGDMRADMDKVRAFYAPIRGKFPEYESVPRLKEETSLDTLAA